MSDEAGEGKGAGRDAGGTKGAAKSVVDRCAEIHSAGALREGECGTARKKLKNCNVFAIRNFQVSVFKGS